MTNTLIRPIEIFFSYAHADERLRNLLENHLSSLRREGLIRNWHDRQIVAGMDWEQTIDTHLNSASVILLLVSPDFMNSDYCYGIEMRRAMERHQLGGALVIPIILRPVDWQGTPFARLQALPTGGRPITKWSNRDAAFLDVVNGIRRAIEDLAERSPSSAPPLDITRLPGKAISYFASLEDYLKDQPKQQARHRFPVESDFSQNLVYLPETYASRMQMLLQEKRRVLLVGDSAAGKTVLAVAFGKYVRDEGQYAVAYKNAARARDGEGALWYELTLAHDRPGTLYILDNCHLAREAVNEFCFQWESRAPEHAQCILISRPGAEESETRFEAMRDYFESCAGETIEVLPQEIYRGVLERYATVYQQQDPARYVALEDDSAAMLERQHAHNLVISKSRLDAWHELGGRLSQVKEERIYQALREKYLSTSKVALPLLCVLRQYEIPAHNLFVETKLPQDEVGLLEQEKLLTSTAVSQYGVFYELHFHPAEAREIFKAHIYRQYGQITSKQLSQSIADILKAYLSANPSNYLAVYQALYTDNWQQKQKALLKRLLLDRELQEYAASHFETGSIVDALRYIYRLARFDTARARELLSLLEREVGLQDMGARIAAYPFQHIGSVLDCLREVNPELAQRVADILDVQYLASMAEVQSLQSLFKLAQILNEISPARTQAFLAFIPLQTWIRLATANNLASMVSTLQKFDPTFQRERFVAALDMDEMVRQSMRAGLSLQRLAALLRVVKATSPEQAKALLAGIPLYVLAQKVNKSNLSSIEQILGYMQESGFSPVLLEELVGSLDVEQLLRRAETENLQHLYWLLRAMQKISPDGAVAIVEKMTPAGLAALCSSKEAGLSDIQQFAKVVPKRFWWRFLQKFAPYDIAQICNRSALGTVGSFMLHEYSFLERGYPLFQKLFLKNRLETEPLDEIGKFLHRLHSIPRRGAGLSQKALALLATTQLSARVVEGDLEQYALLLHNAHMIDRNYPVQLLAPIHEVEIFQPLLAQSSIHGIQMLIHNVAARDANTENDPLHALHQGLQTVSLSNALEQAKLKDIGRFLWNVHEHIDLSLAQEYCWLVDSQQRPAQLASAPLDELSLFLWNLVSLSTSPTLSLFNEPMLRQRLAEAWKTDIGPAATLLGTLAIVQPTTDFREALSSLRGRQEQLTTYLRLCLSERRPYVLALTLQGLRVYSEETAQTIIKRYLPIEEIARVLGTTQREARTAHSRTLLDEIIEWLTKSGRN
jgi:GTPase SAR1 family protein